MLENTHLPTYTCRVILTWILRRNYIMTLSYNHLYKFLKKNACFGVVVSAPIVMFKGDQVVLGTSTFDETNGRR